MPAPVELTFDLLVRPHQAAGAIETVRAVPELTFVLDHLGNPPVATGEREPWATWLRTLAEEPNVVAKLSGLVTAADWTRWTAEDLWPYTDVALTAFGPDRLMYGSDWPVCLLAGTRGSTRPWNSSPRTCPRRNATWCSTTPHTCVQPEAIASPNG